MMGGNISMPASAMAPIEPGPSRVGFGLRLRWMLMWMETGSPMSWAAAKKRSSSGERSSRPDGQVERITPRKPASLQRVISAIMASTPRFGICASGKRRSGSTAQNSWEIQSL